MRDTHRQDLLLGCKLELQRQNSTENCRPILKGYGTLEPDAAKVARPVLKGLGVGNDPRLLDIEIG